MHLPILSALSKGGLSKLLSSTSNVQLNSCLIMARVITFRDWVNRTADFGATMSYINWVFALIRL